MTFSNKKRRCLSWFNMLRQRLFYAIDSSLRSFARIFAFVIRFRDSGAYMRRESLSFILAHLL